MTQKEKREHDSGYYRSFGSNVMPKRFGQGNPQKPKVKNYGRKK